MDKLLAVRRPRPVLVLGHDEAEAAAGARERPAPGGRPGPARARPVRRVHPAHVRRARAQRDVPVHLRRPVRRHRRLQRAPHGEVRGHGHGRVSSSPGRPRRDCRARDAARLNPPCATMPA